MAEFVASGRIVDLVLAVTVLEGLALLLWRWRTGTGITVVPLAAMLAPGAALMLALRAALTGAEWVWIALWLTAAGVLHLIDLRQRWPTKRSG